MFMFNKKLCLAIALIGLPLASQAKSLACPFTDKFIINSKPQAKILSANTQGNLRYANPSNDFFTLSCGNEANGQSGNLFVEIGIDSSNKCDLVIHDGPYEMNPTVTSINCTGPKKFTYTGIEHPFGSYEYTLRFSTFN